MNADSQQNPLTLAFIYTGEFAEKVIRNLINDPSFCKTCGLYCDHCKYDVYSHVRNIRAAIQLPDSSQLPAFIDDPEKHLPTKLPKADLCIASGIHKDLLLELPHLLEAAEMKGLIIPIEDFTEVPIGLKRQTSEICQELGLESSFPKPFCSLEPSHDKPTISRFVKELKIGRPHLEITLDQKKTDEVIQSTIVKQSAPCGSTWYIARKLLNVSTEQTRLYDAIAKAHHSYPCTATMAVDPEIDEPILHLGGFIIREAVEKALQNAERPP
ncbi:MAG: thymidylate synthase [Candidatus Bathyarchaeota archaeon]|nr:MAG: thymidylate synthase [Candidatus Bathyarchaeota archaeon]